MTAPARKKPQPAAKAGTAKPSAASAAKASKAATAAPAKAAAKAVPAKDSAVPRPRGRAGKASAASVQLTFQEPAAAAEEPTADVVAEVTELATAAIEAADTSRYVNGVLVVGYETLYSPKSYTSGPKAGQRAPMTKRHLVLLKDGSKVNGCTGCTFTGSLNDVIAHVRNVDHPNPAPVSGAVPESAVEETLLLAEDMPKQKTTGTHVPSQVLMLTIGQAIQFGLNTEAWQRDRARLEAKLHESEERRRDAEREVKRLTAELGRIGGILQRAAGVAGKAETKADN